MRGRGAKPQLISDIFIDASFQGMKFKKSIGSYWGSATPMSTTISAWPIENGEYVPTSYTGRCPSWKLGCIDQDGYQHGCSRQCLEMAVWCLLTESKGSWQRRKPFDAGRRALPMASTWMIVWIALTLALIPSYKHILDEVMSRVPRTPMPRHRIPTEGTTMAVGSNLIGFCDPLCGGLWAGPSTGKGDFMRDYIDSRW